MMKRQLIWTAVIAVLAVGVVALSHYGTPKASAFPVWSYHANNRVTFEDGYPKSLNAANQPPQYQVNIQWWSDYYDAPGQGAVNAYAPGQTVMVLLSNTASWQSAAILQPNGNVTDADPSNAISGVFTGIQPSANDIYSVLIYQQLVRQNLSAQGIDTSSLPGEVWVVNTYTPSAGLTGQYPAGVSSAAQHLHCNWSRNGPPYSISGSNLTLHGYTVATEIPAGGILYSSSMTQITRFAVMIRQSDGKVVCFFPLGDDEQDYAIWNITHQTPGTGTWSTYVYDFRVAIDGTTEVAPKTLTAALTTECDVTIP